MSNPTDELAATKDAATKMLKQVDALQEKLRGNLEHQSLLLRVTRLRTEIDIAKRDIETMITLAQASGGKPKVDDLTRLLKEKEQELQELEAKYGIQSEDKQHKRFWEFWK